MTQRTHNTGTGSNRAVQGQALQTPPSAHPQLNPPAVDWLPILQAILPRERPASTMWNRPDQIARLLQHFVLKGAFQTLLPEGGGDELLGVRRFGARGLELDFGQLLSVQVLSLALETFFERPDLTFLFLAAQTEPSRDRPLNIDDDGSDEQRLFISPTRRNFVIAHKLSPIIRAQKSYWFLTWGWDQDSFRRACEYSI